MFWMPYGYQPRNAIDGNSIYTGIVATRGMYPSIRTATTAANVRSAHFARANISSVQVLFPNVSSIGEAAPGAIMSMVAYVEYPAGVFTQILFSGSGTGTIPDGSFLLSDSLTIPITNSDLFWFKMFQQCSAGLVASVNTTSGYVDELLAEAYENSSSNHTLTEIPNTLNTSQYHPTIIGPTTAPSVVIFGDSRASGVSDTPDFSGDAGEIARTIGPKFGYFNGGMNAEKATEFISNHTQRASVLAYGTHVPVTYATNDIFAGDSAATIEGHLSTIYGYCTGKTVFQTTVVPRTTSIDGWATTVNQTVLAAESVRTTLNADLRSTFAPGGGVFDTAAVVEAASGKWVANKTTDGVHADQSGALDIKNSGAIDTSRIGTAIALPTDTGSAWLDTGLLITKSTIRRANDTVSHSGAATFSTARGASSHNSGLFYFEEVILAKDPAAGSYVTGIIDGTTPAGVGLDSYLGNIIASCGLALGGGAGGAMYNFAAGTPFTTTNVGSDVLVKTGDVFRWAIDFTNKFAYVARNNTWLRSGDPTSGATGTGNVATWSGTLALYPGISMYNSTALLSRLNTASFLYTLPSGYSAWG